MLQYEILAKDSETGPLGTEAAAESGAEAMSKRTHGLQVGQTLPQVSSFVQAVSLASPTYPSSYPCGTKKCVQCEGGVDGEYGRERV